MSTLEHFPEKWTPVFRRKCDQLKKLERVSEFNLIETRSSVASVVASSSRICRL